MAASPDGHSKTLPKTVNFAANDSIQSICCKPLRLLELSLTSVCFSFLFLLRKYNIAYDTVLNTSVIIYLFMTHVPLTILLSADILCEVLRSPISNMPMMLVLVLGVILTFIAGTVLLVHRVAYSAYNAFRTLNAISLLAAGSWFCTLVFLVDAIIVFKFA